MVLEVLLKHYWGKLTKIQVNNLFTFLNSRLKMSSTVPLLKNLKYSLKLEFETHKKYVSQDILFP